MSPLEIVLTATNAVTLLALGLSIRATGAWIHARELTSERHIRGPAPEDRF